MSESLVGREVVGNFGAMHSTEEGVINGTRVQDYQRQVLVQWGDSSEWINVTEIKYPGQLSPNGSSIGVFWKMSAEWMAAWT